jgi:hypothetical protein
MTSVFASSAIDGIPSDYSVPSEPVCEASSAPVTGVGGAGSSLSGSVLHDPDETFDYFQAQGRRDSIKTGQQK